MSDYTETHIPQSSEEAKEWLEETKKYVEQLHTKVDVIKTKQLVEHYHENSNTTDS